MPKLRKTTKNAVLRRDGAACRYCGWRVYKDVDEAHPRRLTLDHLWPDHDDGSNGIHNLVVSCRQCNRRKGPDLPTGKWLPLPPPPFPPALTAWKATKMCSGPIVPVDRGRIYVPFLSRDAIRARDGGPGGDRQAMYEMRWHLMAPFDPSVDDVTTP